MGFCYSRIRAESLIFDRLGQECQPEGFPTAPPNEALFDPKKVVIVSNGRCASSCSLFSVCRKHTISFFLLLTTCRSQCQKRKDRRRLSWAAEKMSSNNTVGLLVDSRLTSLLLTRRSRSGNGKKYSAV